MFQWRPRIFQDLVSGAGGLRGRATRGAAWSSIGFAGVYAIRLASTLILTRLLAPEAFGLMAIATLVVGALNMFSDLGVRQSVIRSPRGTEVEYLRTAWTLNVARGTGIALVALGLAWPMARLYDEPLLGPIIMVLALSPFLRGWESISSATAMREIDLRVPTYIELTVKLSTTIVTVIVAWVTESVWALVVGILFGVALGVVLNHTFLTPFPHRLRIERAAAGEILRFGGWLFVATLLGYFGGEGINLIIGLLVTTETLGLIAIGTVISYALRDLIFRLMATVGLASLAEIYRDRRHDFRRAIGRIQKIMLIALMPSFVLLSVLAQDLVDLLYDDRYAMAGTFLSILSITAALGVVNQPYTFAFLSAGDSRTHAMIAGAGAVLRMLGAVAGYQFGGVIWLLAGIAVGTLLTVVVTVAVATRRNLANLWLDIGVVGLLSAALALAVVRAA